MLTIYTENLRDVTQYRENVQKYNGALPLAWKSPTKIYSKYRDILNYKINENIKVKIETIPKE